MGILNWLGIGADLAKPIDSISKLYTTDKERLDAEVELQKAIAPSIQGQQEINKIFAMSASFYNNGWIPLAGWTCGAMVALYYVPQLIIVNYVWGMNCLATGKIEVFPIDPSDIYNLVYLVFGFGAYNLVKRKIDK